MSRRIPEGQSAVSVETTVPRLVFSLRMHEDLVEQLRETKDLSLQLRLSRQDPSQNMLVMNHGQISLPLARVEEGQSVDVVRRDKFDGKLRIVGKVKEKLLAKPELQLAKMAQIREVSEAAERARHARRILALEDDCDPISSKRKATQNPISRTKRPTIRRPAPSILGGNSHSSISDLESHDSWSMTDGSTAGKDTANNVTVAPEKPKSLVSHRKSAVKQLISRLPSVGLSRSPAPPTDVRNAEDQYHQLEEEFGKRYQEYLSLNDWIDKRLAVFADLRDQLCASTSCIPDQQLMFRLVVEERRLKADVTYGEKLEQLEEACAALMMIKARIKEIAEQQFPRSDGVAKVGQGPS